jgi:hypothetical protein
MATEKQIAANRANALRSTGPKTAAGKQKSSRNALRHGLSASADLDAAMLAKIELIANELPYDEETEDRSASALDFACAHVDLLRIRAIRSEYFTQGSSHDCALKELRRLAALDRYERYALTKRKRALRKLKS